MRVMFILPALLLGCGSRHEVSGEAKIRHVLTVEAEICNELPPEKKVECIETILTILEEGTSDETNPPRKTFGL